MNAGSTAVSASVAGQLILFRDARSRRRRPPAFQPGYPATFPPEKQGAAQSLFSVAGLFAPVIGPTLGGWITDQYSWRWIFLINLPVGALALFLCWLMV